MDAAPVFLTPVNQQQPHVHSAQSPRPVAFPANPSLPMPVPRHFGPRTILRAQRPTELAQNNDTDMAEVLQNVQTTWNKQQQSWQEMVAMVDEDRTANQDMISRLATADQKIMDQDIKLAMLTAEGDRALKERHLFEAIVQEHVEKEEAYKDCHTELKRHKALF